MKTVKTAKIKVVNFSDLKIGDSILWSNVKRTIIDKDFDIYVKDLLDGNKIEKLKMFMTYYKIEECEEVEEPKCE